MDDRTSAPQRAAAGLWKTSTASRSSRRRFRRVNLTALLPVIAAVGVLLVARQAQTWDQALVLGAGLLAALVAFERWSAGDLARVAAPCLLVSAAVWPYGALVVDGDTQAAYYALAVVACLVVPELPRHRAAAAVGVGLYVAAVGTWGLVAAGPFSAGALISFVILPTGFTVVSICLRLPNKGFYDVMTELEEAREREAELAVVRERVRFASDLHDIQGHTLHVVKLKIALAQKLLRADTARAEQELRETYDLVGDTIAQAKELAYGRRRPNLSAELENARNLLEAAGIHVRVDHPTSVRAQPGDLLAQVLRETTTNVLRHSRATLVHVAVTDHGITIVNDGVDGHPPPTLRGLSLLASRVADNGGTLTAELADDRFRTAATFPAGAAGAAGADLRPEEDAR
ncbi:histidine kinase [Isoptericola sp. S6320L]|uniref:sensor histidine kinase n=1 Tax=Isoptericola sp. S6320L TaxID=2926411 RepID=UPI001FF6FA07|nr:histidine kinase [Isoptericola sp. S6320L]MCK0116383.1 histidine kinase [Isoptericola sp. S6320L]